MNTRSTERYSFVFCFLFIFPLDTFSTLLFLGTSPWSPKGSNPYTSPLVHALQSGITCWIGTTSTTPAQHRIYSNHMEKTLWLLTFSHLYATEIRHFQGKHTHRHTHICREPKPHFSPQPNGEVGIILIYITGAQRHRLGGGHRHKRVGRPARALYCVQSVFSRHKRVGRPDTLRPGSIVQGLFLMQ